MDDPRGHALRAGLPRDPPMNMQADLDVHGYQISARSLQVPSSRCSLVMADVTVVLPPSDGVSWPLTKADGGSADPDRLFSCPPAFQPFPSQCEPLSVATYPCAYKDEHLHGINKSNVRINVHRRLVQSKTAACTVNVRTALLLCVCPRNRRGDFSHPKSS